MKKTRQLWAKGAGVLCAVMFLQSFLPSAGIIRAHEEPARSPLVENAATGKNIDPRFQVPYVSTYYFDPQPTIRDTVKIPLYITDYAQSEYLKNDSSARMDLLYEVDGVEKTISNLPLGDYTLTLGKLSAGVHQFALQAVDPKTGLRSHKLYNELWVVDPSTYEMRSSQIYRMTTNDLTRYGIHNDDSKDPTALNTTRDGLTKMFSDLQAAGYRKVVLLKGTYRINGEKQGNEDTCIDIPSHFTVDMNGSTFKLNTVPQVSGQKSSACLVRMYDAVDAHLTNGILEGDRYERKAVGWETGFDGEHISTLVINGGKYCSVTNMTIKNTTGHTLGSGFVPGPYKQIPSYTKTAILSDGREVANANCSTSCLMDLTDIIKWNQSCWQSESDPAYWNKDVKNYVYIAQPWGYRGIQGDSPIVYASFYDANKKFITSVTAYQFRKIQIPEGAKYVRATLAGDIAGAGQTLFVYGRHIGDYYTIRDVDFYDTRTTALVASCCNNLLVENCSYTRCGCSITPVAVDFEDGAQECQDVYYRNNTLVENSPTTTATLIDCFGYNHVYENCKSHFIEIRKRVVGAVVRNMNDEGTSLKCYVGSHKTNAYSRICDNNCGPIWFSAAPDEGDECTQVKVKNSTITCRPSVTMWITSVADKVVYENCTFPNLTGEHATFKDCVIQPGGRLGNDLYFYNCTFKTLDGTSDPVTVKFTEPYSGNRLFENCKFIGKTSLQDSFHFGTFKKCSFEDLRITAVVHEAKSEITFEDCSIRSSQEEFLYIGPWVRSLEYINVVFRNCEITHTGNKLIYLYARTKTNSRVLFENCTINKTNGWLVSGYSGYDFGDEGKTVSLDIIFRNTKLDASVVADNKITYSDKVHVIYENQATPSPTQKVTPTKKPTPSPTKKATPSPTKKVTPTPTKKATPTPTKKVTPTPVAKPAVPKNVKAVPSTTTRIIVSWDAVNGADGYQVWRSTSAAGTFTALGSYTETSKISMGLTTGATYYYKIRAYKLVDGKKYFGSYSTVVSATTKPAAPAGVKAAVSSATAVTVSWNKVTGAFGYEVWRCETSNGTYVKLGSLTETSRRCPGLTSGKTYYFKVRAYVEVNGTKYYSAYSSVVSAKPK